LGALPLLNYNIHTLQRMEAITILPFHIREPSPPDATKLELHARGSGIFVQDSA